MTPTYFSNVGTLQQNALNPNGNFGNRQADNRYISGQLAFAYARYTITAAEDNDETIGMIWLPAGCIVVPQFTRIWSDDDFDAVDIGFSEDDDQFFAITDFSSTKDYLVSAGTLNPIVPYVVTDQGDGGDWLIITIEDKTDLTAGKFIDVSLAYVVAQ